MVVFFGAIFPSVVQIFCIIGSFWCKFSMGPVRLAKTSDIHYSLKQMQQVNSKLNKSIWHKTLSSSRLYDKLMIEGALQQESWMTS